MFGVDRNEFFKTDDADFSMEPFNGVSNGGDTPLAIFKSALGSLPRPRSGFVHMTA